MAHFPHTPGKAAPDDRIVADLDGKLLAGLRRANPEELPHLAVADTTHHRSIRIALLHDNAQVAGRRRHDYRLDGDGIHGVRRWRTVLRFIGRSLRTAERLDMAEMRLQRLDASRDPDIRLDPEIVSRIGVPSESDQCELRGTKPDGIVLESGREARVPDIADGSVDATITFAGSAPMDAVGAWVITAPPDFAPDTTPLTTLYDIVQQVVGIPLPARLTYPQDIEPILRRAANLFFVNTEPVWQTMHDHLVNKSNLSDNSATAAETRGTVRDDMLSAEDQMSDYLLTGRQKLILDQWVQGNFDRAADATRQEDAGALLDRACLERCVGGGFFPGIEAGTILRLPSIHAGLARLTRGTFTDFDGTTKQMAPGVVSQRMACPWQADFTECTGNWWPAQRPDITGRAAGGAGAPPWDRGIIVNEPTDPRSHLNMVQHFAQLGVVVANTNGGVTTFGEIGRDPVLDTGV